MVQIREPHRAYMAVLRPAVGAHHNAALSDAVAMVTRVPALQEKGDAVSGLFYEQEVEQRKLLIRLYNSVVKNWLYF